MLLRQKLSPNSSYWKNFLSEHFFSDLDYEIPYVGAYEDRIENNLSDSLLEIGVQQYFFIGEEEIHLSEVDIYYLDSLIYWTEDQGLELVLFAGPAHHSTYDKVPEKFKEAFEEKKDFYSGFDHVTMLDYSYLKLPDSCFANHNHMNYRGAEIISHMVKDTLNL